MAADVAEFTISKLKATAAVSNLIIGSADGIFQSGDLTMQQLAENETTRRSDETPTKLLAIVVQDAGENAADEMRHNQRVAIWLYDRERGYTNIRALRKQVYLALQGRSSALTDPYTGRSVMVKLLFQRRTGHMHEARMATDFEALSFSSEVHLEPG